MSRPILNRRNFLFMGATATAAFAAQSLQAAPVEKKKKQKKEKKKKKIIYRTLGNTGIEVPIVSMGVMRADNPAILKAAYELGVRHFDTASGYQDGRNEEMVGQFFKDIPRNQVIISTKIHPPKEGLSTEQFLANFDESLKRLQMSYVDILYLHVANDRAYTLDPRYTEALRKAKESGKARFVGCSTHSNMAEVLNAAVDSKLYDVVLTSYNFRMKDDAEFHKALQRANDAGLGIVGMKNMAGGFLDKERKKPVNCRAALKWALSNPLIHTCIPGITNFEMLKDNWKVAKDHKMDDTERMDLQLAMNETGLYCHGCLSCSGQCPKDLPIPDLMRSYMYNYGYAYPAKAYSTVVKLNVSANPCEGCPGCTVKCPKGLNVQERITDIAGIQLVSTNYLV
ncbi:MAG: aldo/keto reductase [Marinilabiliales bacterium]|nr:aldo/keto reductase [Marinilabiliales bacterium]